MLRQPQYGDGILLVLWDCIIQCALLLIHVRTFNITELPDHFICTGPK